jgi:hypothetical protein
MRATQTTVTFSIFQGLPGPKPGTGIIYKIHLIDMNGLMDGVIIKELMPGRDPYPTPTPRREVWRGLYVKIKAREWPILRVEHGPIDPLELSGQRNRRKVNIQRDLGR